MTALKLVSNSAQAIRNIQKFHSELASSPELQRLMRRSPAWYAVRTGEAFVLAPSKFVGYLDNTHSDYLANHGADGAHDGRITEDLLARWFEDVPAGSALERQLRGALSALLKPYGKSPNARARFRIATEEPEKISVIQRKALSSAQPDGGTAWIVFDPEICLGKPTLRGTRIRVSDVMQLLAGGDTIEQILADFPSLHKEHVNAALIYAANAVDHRVIRAA